MTELTEKDLQKLAKAGSEGAAAGEALRRNLQQVKVTRNAAKGEYIFTCPVRGEEWNDEEYPDIKARIQRRGNCPNCEDREEDK